MTDDSTAKQYVAALYDRAAPSYDRVGPSFFQHAARRLVELAEVRPGARVLDVGTGRGAVLFAAVERIGPQGYALGVDLSEGMVGQAAEEIARRGVRNASVVRMDAEHLGLTDEVFEFVLCSFAIFFFPHLDQTLLELRRVLRPAGRIGVALALRWTDPRWLWHQELIGKYARVEPFFQSAPSLQQPGQVAAYLARAGFANVREVIEEADLTYRDADEWWQALWTHGERRALESMTPDDLARFRDETYHHLAEMARRGPLTITYRFSFVLADDVKKS